MHAEYNTPAAKLQAEPEWKYLTKDGWTGYQIQPDELHPGLSDVVNGKERPWKKHRQESELLTMYLEQLAIDDPENAARWLAKAERVNRCACWAEFQQLPNGSGMRLHDASFCRVRLCPMCQWRRSLKLGFQARQVIATANAAKESRDGVPYGWLLLTLTVRNVPGSDLAPTLDHLHNALNKMQHSKRWKASICGWMRATEITRNYNRKSEWCDTFHPHLHLLLCVNKRYFKSSAYISKAEWQKMWQHYADTDYPPEVDVRAVRDKKTGKLAQESGAASISGAISETSKYIAKPAAYLSPEDTAGSLDAVRVLDIATEGRRLTAFGGILKDTARRLKLDDAENGDLVHIDTSESGDAAADAAAEYISYAWSIGARDYLRTGSRTGAAPAAEKAEKRAKRAETAAAAAEHQRQESETAMNNRAAEYAENPLEGVKARRRHTIRLLQDDAAARALAADTRSEQQRAEKTALDMIRSGVKSTAAAVRAETGCTRQDAARIARAMKDLEAESFTTVEGAWNEE